MIGVQAGNDDVPVNRMRAGEVSTNELAELLSPSLFADERVVVLEAAAEAGKDAVALIAGTAAVSCIGCGVVSAPLALTITWY